MWALPTSIRPGWKGLQGTNTQAYLASLSVTKKKMVHNTGPRRLTILMLAGQTMSDKIEKAKDSLQNFLVTSSKI
jgi:hypothetical protein